MVVVCFKAKSSVFFFFNKNIKLMFYLGVILIF